MWNSVRYDLLRTITTSVYSVSMDQAANLFRHANDKTFKRWMSDLQDAGLLTTDYPAFWRVTPPGRKIVEMGYVSTSDLRLMRRFLELDGPARAEEVQADDELLSSLRTRIQHLRKMKWLSSEEGYRNQKFRTLYKLTYQGRRVLEAYQPLKFEE